MDHPVTYEIGVAGEMPAHWQEYLDGSVMRVARDHQPVVTILTCEMKDQAQLIGVLNMLYTWGSVLLWLECAPAGGGHAD